MTFNGVAATAISSWSDPSITVTVPSGASAGNVVVTVNGTASTGVPFVVTPGISYLSPSSGAVGTSVTITGSGFGASQSGSTITFNGVSAASVSNWSNTSITLPVPVGASSGPVVVTVGGLASNSKTFGIPSTVTSVSPTSGVAGTQVTVSGSGFAAVQGTGTVWLGSTLGAVVSWSDSQIVATVASNARSGNALVQQGGALSNSLPFAVATATITSISPTSGVAGTTVTISGSGFGASQGSGQLFLLARPMAWFKAGAMARLWRR